MTKKAVIFHCKNLIVSQVFNVYHWYLIQHAPTFQNRAFCLCSSVPLIVSLSRPHSRCSVRLLKTHTYTACLHVVCLYLSLSLDSYRLAFITAASQKEADDWLWGELLATINKREEESEEQRWEEGKTEGGREWLWCQTSCPLQSLSQRALEHRASVPTTFSVIRSFRDDWMNEYQLQLNVCEVIRSSVWQKQQKKKEECDCSAASVCN